MNSISWECARNSILFGMAGAGRGRILAVLILPACLATLALSGVASLLRRLADMQERHRQRRLLLDLDAHLLRDIGLTRTQIEHAALGAGRAGRRNGATRVLRLSET